MKKPPCPKCSSTSVYLDRDHNMWKTELSLSCYMCGWRLYGQEEIERHVMAFQQKFKTIVGYSFSPGDIDPVLQVPWSATTESGEHNSCAWPPCPRRARKTSKYCSRQCCVKVAHKREKLRKKGELATTESARVV